MRNNKTEEEEEDLDIQKLSIKENSFQKIVVKKQSPYQKQQQQQQQQHGQQPNLYGRAIITTRECAVGCKKKKVIQKQYPIHKLPRLFYARPPDDLNFELLPPLDLNHYSPMIGDCLVILKVSPWRLTTLTKLDSTTGRLRLEFHKVRKSVTFEIKELFEIRRFIV